MIKNHRLGKFAGMFVLLSCTGCSSFISESGPRLSEIMESPQIRVQNVPAPREGYALVLIDAPISNRLATPDPVPQFQPPQTTQPPARIVVGVGDVVQVTVFETGSGGLFIPQDAGARPGNFVQVPPQQVGQDGVISMPFAGRITAAGRSTTEIQREIERKLADRALEPQVVISFIERHSNEISVLGDVNTALRFSMDASGERLLGAIARAAGPRFAGYESLVTIQRDGVAQTALLSHIAADPQQNVQLQPSDVVYVAHEPRYFLALGATGQTTTLSQLDRRFPFGDHDLNLADALAKAGGLQDDRANAKAVFLYRYETRATLEGLGLAVPGTLPEKVPTIYAVDLTSPGGFFLCNRVAMHNGDTIYVSNAPITDVQKVLNILLPFTQSANYVRTATQ